MIYSPLRYPGGKAKLAFFLSKLIKQCNSSVYIEPFAGGAGAALSLLLTEAVEKIIINDCDRAIYAFWHTLTTNSEYLLKEISNVNVTIDEWKRQKDIYLFEKNDLEKLGFATFFLNRTNRSGILRSGPIGGYEQSGKWKVDARFNKDDLIKRISNISKFANRISVYNLDVRDFLSSPFINVKNGFYYFDPPYFKRGQELYKNFLVKKDHYEICEKISMIDNPWIVTYDCVPDILDIYRNHKCYMYCLQYSIVRPNVARELMIFSKDIKVPSKMELLDDGINISLMEINK